MFESKQKPHYLSSIKLNIIDKGVLSAQIIELAHNFSGTGSRKRTTCGPVKSFTTIPYTLLSCIIDDYDIYGHI